jgi:elongation factor P--(R)-beta-lysine ligase
MRCPENKTGGRTPPLQLRACTFEKVRAFFKARGVLEVETPLLYHTTSTAPHLDSFVTEYIPSGEASSLSSSTHKISVSAPQQQKFYLQTSPEFAMKRLLAAQSGNIFQICKAFRNGERGPKHHHEFTLLEWYRLGYDHHKLMDEMEEFLHAMLGVTNCERLTYEQAFTRHAGINPHLATADELKHCVQKHDLDIFHSDIETESHDDKNFWLQLLMTHVIEHHLGNKTATFVYDFPASEAMLAKTRKQKAADGTTIEIAERFEVYVNGMELANGFHELLDAREQKRRFEEELAARREAGLPCPPLDQKLLAALPDIPPCAGVALGLDRLLMLIAKTNSISEVMGITS